MPKALSAELLKMLKDKEEQDGKKGAGSGDSNIVKLEIGAQTFRIVKPKDGDFLRRVFLHYGFGRPFMCARKNFDEDCPACRLASNLMKENTKESLAESKKLYSKEYYFSPVVVREKPEDSPKWWSYNFEFHTDLRAKLVNPQYGDVTDTDEGTDIIVTKKTPKETGTEFGKINKEWSRAVSKLAESDEAVKKLLDSVPDFHQVFPRKSTEEIQSIVDKFMSKSDNAPEDVPGAEPAGSSETAQYGAAPAVEKTGNPDIDAAFASVEEDADKQ